MADFFIYCYSTGGRRRNLIKLLHSARSDIRNGNLVSMAIEHAKANAGL